MYNTEWIYSRCVEEGLFGECSGEWLVELSQVQKQASELREQSLRASLSSWDEICAFCHGLSFKIMRCTGDARRLKTRIEIALETGLRKSNKDGGAHFLLTIRDPHISGRQCSCKL
ncbi:hypothetical protein B0H19DRAFT_1129650 [Mycena capillaripes]|nr:hypothetical protein B0H19DRAFT_1129650 [Mycena capillaripes]